MPGAPERSSWTKCRAGPSSFSKLQELIQRVAYRAAGDSRGVKGLTQSEGTPMGPGPGGEGIAHQSRGRLHAADRKVIDNVHRDHNVAVCALKRARNFFGTGDSTADLLLQATHGKTSIGNPSVDTKPPGVGLLKNRLRLAVARIQTVFIGAGDPLEYFT